MSCVLLGLGTAGPEFSIEQVEAAIIVGTFIYGDRPPCAGKTAASPRAAASLFVWKPARYCPGEGEWHDPL